MHMYLCTLREDADRFRSLFGRMCSTRGMASENVILLSGASVVENFLLNLYCCIRSPSNLKRCFRFTSRNTKKRRARENEQENATTNTSRKIH